MKVIIFVRKNIRDVEIEFLWFVFVYRFIYIYIG